MNRGRTMFSHSAIWSPEVKRFHQKRKSKHHALVVTKRVQVKSCDMETGWVLAGVYCNRFPPASNSPDEFHLDFANGGSNVYRNTGSENNFFEYLSYIFSNPAFRSLKPMTNMKYLDEAALLTLSHHVLVNEPYRLVLFTIPKVGCTQLIKLMRRLGGAPDWTDAPHYKTDRPFLQSLGLERANEILSDPSWTKAVVFRDPAERLLSAYLNKFVYGGGYASHVFRPNGKGMAFAEFLSYVLAPNTDPCLPTGLHEATDPHWRPQRLVGPIERVEPVMNLVGDFASVGSWIEKVLRRVGAWEEYGATGWGKSGSESVFQTNMYPYRTDAASRMGEFYNRETLSAVYSAYAGDIAFARRAGVNLIKHHELTV